MAKQILGSLVFRRNPLTMTIPEQKKTVSEVATYGGSAIFQWEALLVGTKVVLKWKWMYPDQYTGLRTMYLSLASYLWTTDTGAQYTVILSDLKGEYFEAALSEIAYRSNVELVLSIRG